MMCFLNIIMKWSFAQIVPLLCCVFRCNTPGQSFLFSTTTGVNHYVPFKVFLSQGSRKFIYHLNSPRSKGHQREVRTYAEKCDSWRQCLYWMNPCYGNQVTLTRANILIQNLPFINCLWYLKCQCAQCSRENFCCLLFFPSSALAFSEEIRESFDCGSLSALTLSLSASSTTRASHSFHTLNNYKTALGHCYCRKGEAHHLFHSVEIISQQKLGVLVTLVAGHMTNTRSN